MSAPYPLVRNLYAFSTRFGVLRRPSRSGSSPRSASSFLITSCIVLFYIPAPAAQSPDALSADRALGRWYFKVPRVFGGSAKLAEAHLRASLTYDPAGTASHFFLAELLLDQGRTDEARAELHKVLDAPLNPAWEPEGRDFKEKARKILA